MGAQGGSFGFKQPKMVLYINIYNFWGVGGKKSCFSKISVPEKCDFLSFQGPYGAPLWIFLAKNGSKSSVTPLIEKSWPFGPEKIALKMSY